MQEDVWDKTTPLQYTIAAFEEKLKPDIILIIFHNAIYDTFCKKNLTPKHGIRILKRNKAMVHLGFEKRPAQVCQIQFHQIPKHKHLLRRMRENILLQT